MRGRLEAMRAVIQRDVGQRGLARQPERNLLTLTSEDFAAACGSLASHAAPVLGVITGFWIPGPGLGETDGPLGAVYLARTLVELGMGVELYTDSHCLLALQAGLDCLPQVARAVRVQRVDQASLTGLTHLLALERVGPGHTSTSLATQTDSTEEDRALFKEEVPTAEQGRCRTMRGLDVSEQMADIAGHFEAAQRGYRTIGIGDGGNEIGMGKLPWRVLRDNIPNGGLIACQVPTDWLIVAGISNWGAYALAAGVALLRGYQPPAAWFDPALEEAILHRMVECGPLVDGVTGRREATVDGLPFGEYIQPLQQLQAIVRGNS